MFVKPARLYRTEGLVLKAYDYGEADRILTVYTPQLGKLRAAAKGVRRTKSRMSGHVDLLTRSNLLLARGRQLDILTQAETLESFAGLRQDLPRLSYGQYCCELIDAFGMEQQTNYALYVLAVSTLRRLAALPDLALVMRAFELQLLHVAGYRPQLFRCLQCDAPVQANTNHFSCGLGGILCEGCSSADRGAPPISIPALKLMRNLQSNQEAALRITDVTEATHREVERRIREYIVYRLEARPRSLGVLDRLRVEVTLT